MKRFVIFLSGFALSVACGGDTAGPIDPVGDYTLVAYDGKPLPYLYTSDEAGTIEIVAGTETLAADGSYAENWTQRMKYNPTYGCGCTQFLTGFVESGRYEIAGSKVTFHTDWLGGATYTGTLKNGTLTYTRPLRSLTYKK